MQGFFSESQLLSITKPATLTPKCGACGLYRSCKSPKIPIEGKGKKSILVVNSYPNSIGDQIGAHVTRTTEAMLKSVFLDSDVDLYDDCWITSALICHSAHIPSPELIDHCRPNVIKTIEELKPTCIILLGSEAIASVIKWLWKGDVGAYTRWIGSTIPCQSINAWICPTFHPNYIEHEKAGKNPVSEVLFDRHITKALSLAEERPWEVVPDWKSEVTIERDPDKVSRWIRKLITKGKKARCAFDFECNMLKPEGADATIYSASICYDGKHTIAFPWFGSAKKAFRDLMISDVGKIAANMKFEDRWVRKLLGCEVKNWVWDTMIGAHVMDSKQGTKSLKFQAFTRLGFESYNNHIEPLLHSSGGGSMEPNRIDEIDLDDLLLYNGLDSLLEYKLFEIQQEALL